MDAQSCSRAPARNRPSPRAAPAGCTIRRSLQRVSVVSGLPFCPVMTALNSEPPQFAKQSSVSEALRKVNATPYNPISLPMNLKPNWRILCSPNSVRQISNTKGAPMAFRPSLVLAMFVVAGVCSVSSAAKPQPRSSKAAAAYLEPNLHAGQRLGNIFSRALSYKADGFDELAYRTSGTGAYIVTASSPSDVVFDSSFRYDGRPESRGKTEIKDDGRTVCWKDNCSPETDASGPLYN